MMMRQSALERDRDMWLHQYDDREHSNRFEWNMYEIKAQRKLNMGRKVKERRGDWNEKYYRICSHSKR